MGLFRRAEQTETALSLWDRISGVGWIPTVLNLFGAAMITWLASATVWLNAYGPLAWVFAGLFGALMLSWSIVGITKVLTHFFPRRAPIAGAPAGMPISKHTALKLLVRRNQDPQELSKENVWRWNVQKAASREPDGKIAIHWTFIFVTFENAAATSYRRVVSSSNPDIRFDIADLDSRSIVVAVARDIEGETIEIEVSGEPL